MNKYLLRKKIRPYITIARLCKENGDKDSMDRVTKTFVFQATSQKFASPYPLIRIIRGIDTRKNREFCKFRVDGSFMHECKDGFVCIKYRHTLRINIDWKGKIPLNTTG